MRNFRLVLSYDGSRYQGWQRLGNTDNTIQGKLESVLSRMVDAPVEVIGSGRTDAGVHAMGQVANFHAHTDMTAHEICDYLRHYLPEDIGVLSVVEADERFHSRYNALGKTYVYRIWNTNSPCVFDRKYVWVMAEELNIPAMEKAVQYLLGTHDFRAFCSNKNLKKSSVRTLEALNIRQIGQELRFTVTADGFLYNMVRILVGTLVDVGLGKLSPEDMTGILDSRDRRQAGQTAPAKGLCLMEVQYP